MHTFQSASSHSRLRQVHGNSITPGRITNKERKKEREKEQSIYSGLTSIHAIFFQIIGIQTCRFYLPLICISTGVWDSTSLLFQERHLTKLLKVKEGMNEL